MAVGKQLGFLVGLKLDLPLPRFGPRSAESAAQTQWYMDGGAYLSEAWSWSKTSLCGADSGHFQSGSLHSHSALSTRPGGQYRGIDVRWAGQCQGQLGSRPLTAFLKSTVTSWGLPTAGIGLKRLFWISIRCQGKTQTSMLVKQYVGRSSEVQWKRHWRKTDREQENSHPEWPDHTEAEGFQSVSVASSGCG